MATIAQDIRNRPLLLKQYVEKFGITKIPSDTKPTVSIFTAGNDALMALLSLYENFSDVFTIV